MAKKKIVVIHNVKELADSFADALRLRDFDAISASNGEIGLKLIYDYKPDLILSDWKMLKLDGYQLLESVRNDPLIASTLFVFLTAMGSKLEYVREAMDLGADDYLALPIEIDNLLLSIQVRFKRQAQILGIPIDESVKPIRRINHHVFLSYAREDSLTMRRIKNDAQQAHLSVWTDEDLEPGTSAWTNAIQDAIETAGCVVVILSPDAKKSEWVNRELEYAEAHGISVFPILLRGNEREVKPIQLIRVQHSDIRDNYELRIAKLFDSIRSHIGIIG